MTCLIQERGRPCEIGGEGFLRNFEYGGGNNWKKDVLCPGPALVQAESNTCQFTAYQADKEREHPLAGRAKLTIQIPKTQRCRDLQLSQCVVFAS